MVNPGNFGINVQIVLKDAILTITMYKNVLTAAVPATTLLHYAGNSTENAENVPTKSLIIEPMSYVKNAMRYATS